MAINELPRGVLDTILSKLDPFDRLTCALVCRSWEETISSSPSLFKDTWLELRGGSLERDLPMVLKSQRRYHNLRILGADLTTLNPELWTRHGRLLRRLELIDCNLTPDVFCSSLRHCPELESLHISGTWRDDLNYSADMLTLPGGISLDGVRQSLRNVRHLHLELHSSSKPLEVLLKVIPNATSLNLSSMVDELNIGGVVSALRSLPMITKLDCDLNGFDFRADDHIRSLVEMCSGTLRELRLMCALMTHEGFMALGDCVRLRHLTLFRAYTFENCHLEKLIRNVPDLETLDIWRCERLTDAGVKRIHDLKKLRVLRFIGDGISTDAFSGLGAEISTLEDLTLRGSAIDIGIVPSIACLGHLQKLELEVAVEPKGFNMICENFQKLEDLTLWNCSALSDAEGVKIRLFKHLRCITLWRCPELTDLTFERGFGSPAFDQIDIGGCNVTDVGLASIAAHHVRLRKLCFYGCPEITEVGLVSLVKREPFLRELSVSACAGVSNGLLRLLEPVCPKLRRLWICDPIYSADLEAVESFKRKTSCRIYP